MNESGGYIERIRTVAVRFVRSIIFAAVVCVAVGFVGVLFNLSV